MWGCRDSEAVNLGLPREVWGGGVGGGLQGQVGRLSPPPLQDLASERLLSTFPGGTFLTLRRKASNDGRRLQGERRPRASQEHSPATPGPGSSRRARAFCRPFSARCCCSLLGSRRRPRSLTHAFLHSLTPTLGRGLGHPELCRLPAARACDTQSPLYPGVGHTGSRHNTPALT